MLFNISKTTYMEKNKNFILEICKPFSFLKPTKKVIGVFKYFTIVFHNFVYIFPYTTYCSKLNEILAMSD